MSTPSTATATLTPFRPHQPHLSHHSLYTPIPSFRPANALIPSGHRVVCPPPLGSSAPSSGGQYNSNGPKISSSSSSSRPLESPTLPPGVHLIPYNNMTTQTTAADRPSTRKRRRSREPDWISFYKNGLPKEVIVIDDTPEAESQPGTTAASYTIDASNASSNLHTAKRRKRDDAPTHYDPVHHNKYTGSQTNTPYQNVTPSQSAASSDRTTSAINTTAPTSLGSLSSNSQYDYEAQLGQKRKRTTRQQVRREAGALDALSAYRPPPHPLKKAGDVPVRVIPDVSPAHL